MLTFPPTTSSAIAEQALGRGAEGLDDPLCIDDDQGVRRGIEDRAQQGFPSPHFLLGAVCLAAVAGDLRHADDPALLVTDRRDAERDRDDLAVARRRRSVSKCEMLSP